MKTLLFTLAAVLILGCGNNASEDVVQAEDTAAVDTSHVQDAADIPETPNAEPAIETDEMAQTDPALYAIGNGTAGVFCMGSSEEKTFEDALVYSNGTAEAFSVMQEGMETNAIKMNFEDAGSLVLQLSDTDNTVCRIEIYSDLFKTEQGIGIGSTYGDLQDNYEFDGVSWGDSGDPLVVVEDARVSFLLEPGQWWQMGEVQGEIPADTKITSMFVW